MMRIYNDAIIHSALDPYGDSLQHAKYLNKFFKNGKWRYVYEKAKETAKGLRSKGTSSYEDGRRALRNARRARKYMAEDASLAKLDRYEDRDSGNKRNRDYYNLVNMDRHNAKTFRKRYKDSDAAKYDNAVRNIKKAKKAVSSTASDAVSKAKKSVSSVENKLGRYVGERKVKNILSGNGKKAAKAAKSMLDTSKSKTGSTKTVNKEARASNSSSKLSNKPSSTNSVNKKKKSFNSLNGKPKKKSFKSTRRT